MRKTVFYPSRDVSGIRACQPSALQCWPRYPSVGRAIVLGVASERAPVDGLRKNLHIGDVAIPGRVLIAPMTGVSDLPFRRAASALGAPYVATEMVACDSFVRGRPDVVRRAAVGEGLPLMVVQLVGTRARTGSRKRTKPGGRSRRRHHRPQHGLPGQRGHRRTFRLRADARPRSRRAADRCGRRPQRRGPSR